MHEKKKKQPHKNMPAPVNEAVNALKANVHGEILSDILGSYTGTAADGDAPEQDADDL